MLGHEVTSERPPHPMSIELQCVAGSLSLSTSKDTVLHSDFASWFLVMWPQASCCFSPNLRFPHLKNRTQEELQAPFNGSVRGHIETSQIKPQTLGDSLKSNSLFGNSVSSSRVIDTLLAQPFSLDVFFA